MDALILALAPGFVAGFAVQRVLEVLSAAFDYGVSLTFGGNATVDDPKFKARKTFWTAVISILMGLAIAGYAHVRVLQPLQFEAPDEWDLVITALVISAGTEGMNSILKWLGYKKDQAAEKTAG